MAVDDVLKGAYVDPLKLRLLLLHQKPAQNARILRVCSTFSPIFGSRSSA
ncbi:MAG: hypothetical protein AB1717_07005 [Pseudomonadota bacterium]